MRAIIMYFYVFVMYFCNNNNHNYAFLNYFLSFSNGCAFFPPLTYNKIFLYLEYLVDKSVTNPSNYLKRKYSKNIERNIEKFFILKRN